MSSSKKWLIVWCERDTSYSLIDETKAIFNEDDLKPGDEVKFFFNKKEYNGIVREIGGDDEYESLKTKLDELNATNKKARESFHAELPRKNRGGKYSNAVASLKSSSRKPATEKTAMKPATEKTANKPATQKRSSSTSSKDKVPPAKKRTPTPLHKLLGDDDSASSSGSDPTDTEADRTGEFVSPRSSPNPEDRTEEENSMKKKSDQKKNVQGKDSDLRKLKLVNKPDAKPTMNDDSDENFANSACGSFGNVAEGANPTKTPIIVLGDNPELNSDDNQTGGPGLADCNIYTDSDDEEKAKSDHQETARESRRKKKKSKQDKDKDESVGKEDGLKKTGDADAPKFSADKMFKRKSTDPDITAVLGKSRELTEKRIYISTEDLTTAKLAPATQFARALLVATFTDPALFQCTVSGGEFRAQGRSNIRRKPPLDADAIAVIVDVALTRQKTKHWKPEQTKKEIMAGLRQKLVDMRPKLKKLFSSEED